MQAEVPTGTCAAEDTRKFEDLEVHRRHFVVLITKPVGNYWVYLIFFLIPKYRSKITFMLGAGLVSGERSLQQTDRPVSRPRQECRHLRQVNQHKLEPSELNWFKSQWYAFLRYGSMAFWLIPPQQPLSLMRLKKIFPVKRYIFNCLFFQLQIPNIGRKKS